MPRVIGGVMLRVVGGIMCLTPTPFYKKCVVKYTHWTARFDLRSVLCIQAWDHCLSRTVGQRSGQDQANLSQTALQSMPAYKSNSSMSPYVRTYSQPHTRSACRPQKLSNPSRLLPVPVTRTSQKPSRKSAALVHSFTTTLLYTVHTMLSACE